LPPLDDATVEVFKFLKTSYPDLDVEAGRISSYNDPDFKEGLEFRMVDIIPKGKNDFQFKELEDHDVPCPLVEPDIKDYDEKLLGKGPREMLESGARSHLPADYNAIYDRKVSPLLRW
jgi:hypothetical protein